MHAQQLLHNLFEKSVDKVHKRRLTALFATVESLLYGQELTLSGLGRSMQSKAYIRHNIKRVDRLLSNKRLQSDYKIFYQELAKQAIGQTKNPIILIDWSQLGENDKSYFIRASIPYGGRSLAIYEESHPKRLCNTTPTNTEFLDHLQGILPNGCKPIIVTDAGTTFRCPWFKKIKKLRWDFVGRIRGGEKLLINTKGLWLTCKGVYVQAKKQAIHLGTSMLTKRSNFVCEMVLAKRTSKGRHGKYQHESESNDRTYARNATDPWLLATSLNSNLVSAQTIISIYKKRMQIEELFRDTKNERIGFGLKKTLTVSNKRLSILLLIGTIATYLAFIIGKTGQRLSMQRQFLPNSIKHRSVLSTFNLGCQMFLCDRIKIPIAKLLETIHLIPSLMQHTEDRS